MGENPAALCQGERGIKPTAGIQRKKGFKGVRGNLVLNLISV